MGILNITGKRRVLLVRQSEAAECGLASLAMIASYHGHQIDLSAMRRRFNVSMKGMTLKTVIDIGSSIGLSSRPIRCGMSELRNLQTPAILHWGGNHFVVLEGIRGRRCLIQDPSIGPRSLTWSETSRKFTGVALELTPNPEFKPQRGRSPLKLSSLLRFSRETVRALVQSLLLSMVIELLYLTAPLYFQFAIDDAVVKGDVGFMAALAIVFATLLLFRVLADALRSLTLQYVSQILSLEMQSRVFHHMLRLSLEWFHKRHVGDIQSRFGAVQPIKAFIANGAVAGLIDGILASLVLILMALYSPVLTALVLISIGLYLAIRIGSIQLQRRLAGDTIVTQALEQSKFLESLRAIETLKSMGAETLREGQQRNAMAASINASIRSGNIQIVYNATAQIIDGFTEILIVYLGAIYVIHSTVTLGMLTAFLAYKQQFCSRLTNLIGQLITWRLLGVDLERLSDITLSPTEKLHDQLSEREDVIGTLECRNLFFAYAFGERPVLTGLSLRVSAGEYVAITGPSGCGKSTLIKLLIGLYEAGAGEVLLDEKPLSLWNLRTLRKRIAVVTQEDTLLAGSIAENIAMFDEAIDMDLVIACAKLAQIHNDVEAMPMGYETLVGDLGSSLSGGQKQRVLIARALYRRPRILIFDEGTSHLDVDNERAINEALAGLKMTRIVVAHRPETIRSADRRIVLAGGRVVVDETTKWSVAAVDA